MIPDLFEIVDTNVKFSFDPEFLLHDVSINLSREQPEKIKEMKLSNTPFWMSNRGDISIHLMLGNMNTAFPEESNEIIEYVDSLRHKLISISKKSSTSLLLKEVAFGKIGFISIFKLKAFESIDIHHDVTRNLVMNIGLKNSQSHEFNIYKNYNNFYKNLSIHPTEQELIDENYKKYSCIVNNGDVLIFRADHYHQAKCRGVLFNPTEKDRFILSIDIEK